MAGKRHWARRPFGYDDGAGGTRTLDRGEVFDLVGARNDEKLVRLGYCAEVPRGAETFACVECSAVFVDLGARQGHGDARHRRRPLSPEEEDRRIDAQERMLGQVAPLYLDKTLATARA